MRSPVGRPRLRLLGLASLLALSTGVLAVAVELRLTKRARPPLAGRASALAAFEAASSAPSARWAPEALQAADVARRTALLGWSRQQARPLPLRDFRPVADQLARAEALAREAARLGAERRTVGYEAARAAATEARMLERHAAALVAVTTLPRGQRARLQRARLLVREAEALLRAGEIEAARRHAERSQRELREALGPALEAAERYTSRELLLTWRRWVDETRRWSRSTGRPAIVVFKEKNVLVLLSGGERIRAYAAELGANTLDAKRHQGDNATPEGQYRIVKKRDLGQSRFHRALLLDYPSAADRRRFAAAQRRGEIPRAQRIGGLIEIHGDGGRGKNWTEGCVALSNRDIDDLFPRVGVGTRVTIVGGDGRDGVFSDLLTRVDRETAGP